MRALAVIPARAGSARLMFKNIYPLLGKPLIRWITEAVVAAECFEKIMISTDSDLIFQAVSDLNVRRHQRESNYATAQATVLDAMINLMQSIDEKYDVFAYFLPTCPFVTSADIKCGFQRIQDEGVDTVISMTLMQETLQLACLLNDDDVVPVFDNLECGLTNSRFIKKYYKPSGAFYIGKWDHILTNKNFFKGRIKSVLIPPERSIDINTITDIFYAEAVSNNMWVQEDEYRFK